MGTDKEGNGDMATIVNGAARKAAAARAKPAQDKDDIEQKIEQVDADMEQQAAALAKLLGDLSYFLLLQYATRKSINDDLVDEVYEGLRQKFPKGNDKLLVVLSSYGGDIDAAYNLAMQFRRYGKDRLVFVVPRTAKSAATLLVCGGDEVLMTPAAELGPLDPQITQFNPLENRLEQFSPLHIKGTLELINDQYKENKKELADALVKRLQFPLTLGSFRQTLNVSKEYLATLLSSRMLAGVPKERVKEVAEQITEEAGLIAERLAEGYAGHGACILCEEANGFGLKASLLSGEAEEAAWSIHQLERRKRELLKERKKRQMKEELGDLPPELLDILRGNGLATPNESEEEVRA